MLWEGKVELLAAHHSTVPVQLPSLSVPRSRLLVPPLHGAVALKEVDRVAVRVGEHLHLRR